MSNTFNLISFHLNGYKGVWTRGPGAGQFRVSRSGAWLSNIIHYLSHPACLRHVYVSLKCFPKPTNGNQHQPPVSQSMLKLENWIDNTIGKIHSICIWIVTTIDKIYYCITGIAYFHSYRNAHTVIPLSTSQIEIPQLKQSKAMVTLGIYIMGGEVDIDWLIKSIQITFLLGHIHSEW